MSTIALSIPDDLIAELKRLAQLAGVSFNQYTITGLDIWVRTEGRVQDLFTEPSD